GTLMQKLDNNTHLILPTSFLSIVNVVSIVFAILSVRPNVSKGTFTEDDIRTGKTNLLFFGNFHGMKRDEYHWGMNRLMDNGNFLYSNLIDDIYFLGVVLAKKYKYLRSSYTIFMVGIAISLALFILSNFFTT
ncbi:MAG: Pycsar system effector family protein, partial [Bacteroidota bacterium]